MHQIDLGVIISFMKAILRKYLECVENHLNIPGSAAKKLTERLQRMLKKKTTDSGHTMSGKNDCLVPITYGTTFVFMQIYRTSKNSRNCRAIDYRHLLLLLPFILDNLFSNEVNQFNSSRKGQPKVIDPSSELVTVANTFLSWYKLYRRITPAKTLDEIATLQQLSRYLFYYVYYLILFLLFLLFLLLLLFVLFNIV